MIDAPGPCPLVVLCRAGGEDWVRAEVVNRLQAAGEAALPGDCIASGPGWVWLADLSPRVVATPFLFEHQRLPGVMRVAGLDAAAVRQQGLTALGLAAPPSWDGVALHVFGANPGDGRIPQRQVQALARALRQAEPRLREPPAPDGPLNKGGPPDERPPETVLQVCLVADGAWVSLAPAAALSSPYPGGVHRMPPHPAAPSRSFLKLEEALEAMDRQPRAGETAVDLGAAPGGWSYALARRGCRVLAVDNGPLKLQGNELAGHVEHVRADGLRFTPPDAWAPVDWLVADMLVPPGVALGLVRKWLERDWARRLVVNAKLPQQHPLAALAPLMDYLESVPGLWWRLRHLYHDRREVTLLARHEPASGGHSRRRQSKPVGPTARKGGAAKPQREQARPGKGKPPKGAPGRPRRNPSRSKRT